MTGYPVDYDLAVVDSVDLTGFEQVGPDKQIIADSKL